MIRSSFKEDVAQFQQLISDREANLLVIGIPYTMNGEIGFQAKQVIKYAERLSKALDIPIEFVDERLTSIEAEEQLRTDKRFSPRYDKHLIDQRAAAIILQQWLDMR